MFISPAHAQGIGGAFGGIEPLLPLVLIFVVFYFLLIRPQQKKAKAHKEMLGSLRRGDRVVTAGGLIGLITKVINENEMTVEIADGVRVRMVRSMVSDVYAKSGAADGDDDDGESDDEEEEEVKPRRRRRRKAKQDQ
jgi:preprotein translocase subunit YajC